jgi:hypothetical protein
MTREEPADQKDASRPRLLYIDNLRILLTILVILHHLGIGYGAPGTNIYVEAGEISTVSTILMTLCGHQPVVLHGLLFHDLQLLHPRLL